jgi:Fe2+ or Zn2+ uptake regulation protein
MDLRPLDSTSASASMAPLCSVFRRYLKSRDLKYTPERADILDAIIERDGVFEPEELLFEMRRREQEKSRQPSGISRQPSAVSREQKTRGTRHSELGTSSSSRSQPLAHSPQLSSPSSRRVSKATIYRTIKLLQEAGIITQALFDSKQSHYRLIYGRAPRDYMTCLKTGRMVEFSDDALIALRARIAASHDAAHGGWEPVGHRFQIYALSPEGRRQLASDKEEAGE